MNKVASGLSITLLGVILTATPVFAHSVVSPKQIGIGTFQDFTLGVPSEKPVATTSVKLMIPTGLNYVSPIVKAGWKINVKQTPDPSGKKNDDGNPAMIASEIDWTGGQIPAGQKDLFMFSAQVPSQPRELDWKVEQTYADGSVVSWSLGPNDVQPKDDKGNPTFDSKGPYSKTMVINDLKLTLTPSLNQDNISQSSLPLVFSIAALALSGFSLAQYRMKKLQKK